MAAIFDFRSCDIWEHFYVHRWIDQTPKHGITHQDHLSRLNDTKVMRVFNFGYFGWRPYWIWPKKVPSRFFPPGILIDLANRPPKDNNYVGFKTIPIFSRSNSIFMRLLWGMAKLLRFSVVYYEILTKFCEEFSYGNIPRPTNLPTKNGGKFRYTSWLTPARTNWPLLTQGSLVLCTKITKFCLYYKNLSTESVMYDCHQPQLMY